MVNYSVWDSNTAEIGKLFKKNPYEVSPTREWIDVATKLFRLPKSSRQMKIIDFQEDISLQMYKIAFTKDVWAEHVLNITWTVKHWP